MKYWRVLIKVKKSDVEGITEIVPKHSEETVPAANSLNRIRWNTWNDNTAATKTGRRFLPAAEVFRLVNVFYLPALQIILKRHLNLVDVGRLDGEVVPVGHGAVIDAGRLFVKARGYCFAGFFGNQGYNNLRFAARLLGRLAVPSYPHQNLIKCAELVGQVLFAADFHLQVFISVSSSGK